MLSENYKYQGCRVGVAKKDNRTTRKSPRE